MLRYLRLIIMNIVNKAHAGWAIILNRTYLHTPSLFLWHYLSDDVLPASLVPHPVQQSALQMVTKILVRLCDTMQSFHE